MKGFKTFLKEALLLQEKYNEGDIIEGIFAIAVALHVATPKEKISAKELDKWRKKVDVHLTGEDGKPIAWKQRISTYTAGNPTDTVNVDLQIRMKSVKNVEAAFGTIYKKSGDIESLKRKVKALLTHLQGVKVLKTIDTFVEGILTNKKKDEILFTVIADGVAGEQTKGTIKGDINLKVVATGLSPAAKKAFKKVLPKELELSFSLKSDASTVANLSPYNGQLQIAQMFGLKHSDVWGNLDQYANIIRVKGHTLAEKIKKGKRIFKMFKVFADKLVSSGGTPKFTAAAYKFLNLSIHGTDAADVIEVGKTHIKELSPKTLKYMQEKGITWTAKYVTGGKNKYTQLPVQKVQFFANEGKTTKPVAHMRIRVTGSKSNPNKVEFKLMVELTAYLWAKDKERIKDEEKET